MIYILCSPSCGGKDTIQNEAIERFGLERIVTNTSRPMRIGEVEGKDYFFKTEQEFLEMIDSGKMLEYREYNTCLNGKLNTWYYGLEKRKFEDKNYIIIMDINGANSLIKEVGKKNCTVIYIKSSESVRRKRAMNRPSYDETEYNRREYNDRFDIDPRRLKCEFETIVNEDKTIDEVMNEFAWIIALNIMPKPCLSVHDIEVMSNVDEISTIYLDIDGVVIDSVRAMSGLLNKKYGTNCKPEDITNWDFKNINPDITSEEVEELFSDAEFFDTVLFYKHVFNFINKYRHKIRFLTKGNIENIHKKYILFQNVGLGNIPIIGLPLSLSKGLINMSAEGKSIFIDDSVNNLNESNAYIKILFKEYDNNADWQQGWNGLTMKSWD